MSSVWSKYFWSFFSLLNDIILGIFSSVDPATKNDLININSTTGVLRVLSDEIDCDVPVKIYFLHYNVILTDGVWTTRGEILVHIIDINNKKPMVNDNEFEQQISIYENETTGFWIQKVFATDADRDCKIFVDIDLWIYHEILLAAPHCDLRFMINYVNSPELQNLFNINTTTGDLYVNLVNNAYLDRDNGIEYHLININIEDNYLGYGRK